MYFVGYEIYCEIFKLRKKIVVSVDIQIKYCGFEGIKLEIDLYYCNSLCES